MVEVSLMLLSKTACIAAVVEIAVIIGCLIGDMGIMGSGGKGAMGVGRFRVVGAVGTNAFLSVVVGGVGVEGLWGGVAVAVGRAIAVRLIFTPFSVSTFVVVGFGGALGP